MKKTIYILSGILLILFIGMLTVYFERSMQDVHNPLENRFAKPVIKQKETTFVAVSEDTFSDTAKETMQTVVSSSESDATDGSEEFIWQYAEFEIEGVSATEELYIVLEYANTEYTPKAAMCYLPGFTESVTAFSINEAMSGEILFKPQTFSEGVWCVCLFGDEELGTYSLYAISSADYNAQKHPVILKPRDLDAPGAILPEGE